MQMFAIKILLSVTEGYIDRPDLETHNEVSQVLLLLQSYRTITQR